MSKIAMRLHIPEPKGAQGNGKGGTKTQGQIQIQPQGDDKGPWDIPKGLCRLLQPIVMGL